MFKEVVLLFAFMYVVIILSSLLTIHMLDKDEDEGDLLYLFTMVGAMALTISAPILIHEYFSLIAYVLMVPLIIFMWSFMFKADDIYYWLVGKVNFKNRIKNISLKKKLYKNYSKQHADLILKFYKLMIDGKYAEKLSDKHFQLHIPYYLDNRSFSYWEDESYDRINIITRLIEFVNINILYSDNKDYAEATEAILLEKENAKRIVFILNVLEDKEKMEFLSTEEGETQLKVFGNDLIGLNRNIKNNVEKIIELTKKTKANKMNEDFNLLRKNSFDEIEEMRRD